MLPCPRDYRRHVILSQEETEILKKDIMRIMETLEN